MTSQEIEALKAERDELAAQVEVCSAALKSLLKTPLGIGGSLQADGQFYYKVPESVFKKAESTLAKTPQQCLRDVRAEAGWAGYLEAALNYDPDYDPWWSASQYAESVRQGGAE